MRSVAGSVCCCADLLVVVAFQSGMRVRVLLSGGSAGAVGQLDTGQHFVEQHRMLATARQAAVRWFTLVVQVTGASQQIFGNAPAVYQRAGQPVVAGSRAFCTTGDRTCNEFVPRLSWLSTETDDQEASTGTEHLPRVEANR